MRLILSVLVGAFFLMGCAGQAVQGDRAKERPVPRTFEGLRSLVSTRASSERLIASFGLPDKTVALSGDHDAWTYLGVGGSQRAAFVIERGSGKVIGATWYPRRLERLYGKRSALAAFPGAKFEVREVGRIDGRDYSHEAHYVDRRRGVAMLVAKKTQTVSTISLE